MLKTKNTNYLYVNLVALYVEALTLNYFFNNGTLTALALALTMLTSSVLFYRNVNRNIFDFKNKTNIALTTTIMFITCTALLVKAPSLQLLIPILLAVTLSPISEELFFRGVAYDTLQKGYLNKYYKDLNPIILSTALFTLAHLLLKPPVETGGILAITTMGLISAALKSRTRHVNYSITLHAAYNSILALTILF